MSNQDGPHFFEQMEVGVRRARVGSQRHSHLVVEQLSQGIRLMLEIGMRARTVDQRQTIGSRGEKPPFFRGQVVAVDDERPVRLGQ